MFNFKIAPQSGTLNPGTRETQGAGRTLNNRLFNHFASHFLWLFLPLLGTATLGTQVAAATPPAKAFGQLPRVQDAAISPDGKRIAVIVNYKGSYGVLTQTTTKSEERPWLQPLGEEVKPRYVKWINNQRYVVSIAKSESHRGTPFTTSYLFTSSTDDRKPKLVVYSRKIFRQFNDRVVDWLEDDPEHILMAYSDEAFDPYPDVKKVKVATGRSRTVKRGIVGIEYWTTDTKGTPRIGQGTRDDGSRKLMIYNTTTEKWENSKHYPGLSPDTSIYGLLNNGQEMVIGSYEGQDTKGLYIYDLRQRKTTRKIFHDDAHDASGVVFSKDGESIIGAKYTAERDETVLLDDNGTLLDYLRGLYEGYDVNFVDQTQDLKTVLVTMSAPYDPGGLYLYSAGSEYPVRLSEMYKGITDEDTGNVTAVHYTARDGQKIPAFVTFPPSVVDQEQFKNLPFIILPHGGPFARDSKRFDYLAQFFATRGYGVLQMNFRGSEGYGRAFKEAGRNNWVVMQEDVEDGARWLLKRGYADPDKTCIAGWSYGGYAALMGVAKDPELYQCAIAMAALTDINDAKRDMRKYRGGRHAAKEFFGNAFKDAATRKANSPVNVAHQIKVPVFLAHGDKDENVQFDQFTRMRKSLKRAGTKATFLAFEDEDHYLSKQKNREAFFIGMEKFLLEVNGKSPFMD